MKDIKEISQILKDKKKELEEKIETEQIPTLTILLTSYSNILQSNKQILQEFLPEEYSLHEETINNLRKVINNRSKKQNDLNDSIYSENINLQFEEEEDFFNLGKRRVNEYLSSAIDSLDSIRRQGRILEGAQNKVAEGLRKMGFSEGMINQITSRDNLIDGIKEMNAILDLFEQNNIELGVEAFEMLFPKQARIIIDDSSLSKEEKIVAFKEMILCDLQRKSEELADSYQTEMQLIKDSQGRKKERTRQVRSKGASRYPELYEEVGEYQSDSQSVRSKRQGKLPNDQVEKSVKPKKAAQPVSSESSDSDTKGAKSMKPLTSQSKKVSRSCDELRDDDFVSRSRPFDQRRERATREMSYDHEENLPSKPSKKSNKSKSGMTEEFSDSESIRSSAQFRRKQLESPYKEIPDLEENVVSERPQKRSSKSEKKNYSDYAEITEFEENANEPRKYVPHVTRKNKPSDYDEVQDLDDKPRGIAKKIERRKAQSKSEEVPESTGRTSRMKGDLKAEDRSRSKSPFAFARIAAKLNLAKKKTRAAPEEPAAPSERLYAKVTKPKKDTSVEDNLSSQQDESNQFEAEENVSENERKRAPAVPARRYVQKNQNEQDFEDEEVPKLPEKVKTSKTRNLPPAEDPEFGFERRISKPRKPLPTADEESFDLNVELTKSGRMRRPAPVQPDHSPVSPHKAQSRSTDRPRVPEKPAQLSKSSSKTVVQSKPSKKVSNDDESDISLEQKTDSNESE